MRRRAQLEVVIFAERHQRRLPVHLGGGRDDDQLLLLRRRGQDRFSSADVRLDRVNGLLDDQAHANGRGEVHGHVGAVHELGDERLVQGRTNAMVKTRATDEVRDVVHAARREVVEDRDRVAALEKPLGQV